MALLQIDEPVPAAGRASWAALLSLGFRPLYLAGTAWAALAVLLWVWAPQALAGTLNGVAWHGHEMLWGFVATIAVGFLATAGANWTGHNPLPPRPLAVLLGLWVLARLGLGWGQGVMYMLAAAADVLFFAAAALALGRVVWRARNHRNAGLPLLLAGLALADALFLSAVARGEPGVAMPWLNAGLALMAMVALLIARRVLPFFAMRALPGLQLPTHARSGAWQLGAVGLAVAGGLAGVPWAQALGLASAGALALWQVLSWQPRAVAQRPILWVLYLGHAGLGVGLLLAAAHMLGWVLRAAWPVHMLAMGGFAVLIIGMVTRTALGHLGRPLPLDGSMLASIGCIVVALVLRLAALLPHPLAPWALRAAALAWAAGFGLYLWRFAPWMWRERADAPPGRPVVIKPRR